MRELRGISRRDRAPSRIHRRAGLYRRCANPDGLQQEGVAEVAREGAQTNTHTLPLMDSTGSGIGGRLSVRANIGALLAIASRNSGGSSSIPGMERTGCPRTSPVSVEDRAVLRTLQHAALERT